MDALKAILALHRTPGFGPAKFKVLLQHDIAPSDLFQNARRELYSDLGLKEETVAYLRQPDWSGVDADLHWQAINANHHIISYLDPQYPALLKEIHDPPLILFLIGDPEVLRYPQLAIVGSRNPSHQGQQTAFEFSRTLSLNGLIINSGLALGIDAQAHLGALAGQGVTVAVTGAGIDRIYPARHKELSHQITRQGAIVSEFVPGTAPLPYHFPRRNRIISGLSIGTLVVEAATRSGSLITARLAMEQGREVFAIPGSIHNPLARGCHALIRQGAKLVETSQDILEDLANHLSLIVNETNHSISHSKTENPPESRLSKEQRIILTALGYTQCSVDWLVEQAKLSPETISALLVELELQGLVICQGGMYSRLHAT